MATLADVIAVAPSLAGGAAYREWGGCGRKTRPSPPQGSGSRTGAEASLTWDVLQSESYVALAAFFGTPTTISVFGWPTVLLTPVEHPDFPGLVADSYHWQDMGWNDSTARESITRITITFRKPPYLLTGEHPYVEVIKEPSGRSIVSPATAWQFSGGERPTINPDGFVGGSRIQWRVYHVPAVFNLSNLDLYARYTNSTSWQNYPAECLLYTGADSQNDQLQIDQPARIVSLEMLSSSPEVPWNYESKADGTLALLTSDGTTTGTRRYPLLNYDTLWNFAV